MVTETVKYQKKELELKALLEITQAINENKAESVLLEIFKFTCLVHLNIKALILYVAGHEGFAERVSYGVKGKTPKTILYRDVQENKEIGKLNLMMSEEYSFSLKYLLMIPKSITMYNGNRINQEFHFFYFKD